MAEDGLRIGLIGCGSWGRNILRDLCGLGCEVYVADPSAEARSAALAGGARQVVDRAPSLPVVDGVVVATPTVRHAEAIIAVVDRRVPVFCEKPLTADAAVAADIAERDAEGLVYLMDKWRYHPGVRALGEIARSGRLGRIQQLRSVRVQWGQPHTDVDGVWILAPHELAIVREILGFLPEPVHATGDFTGDRMDGLLAVLGRDPIALIEVSARSPKRQRSITVSGSDAVAVLADPLADHIELWRGNAGQGLAKKPERWPISTRMPLLLELEHFCGFLRGGDAPLTGSAEAADQVAMLERLRGMAMRALR